MSYVFQAHLRIRGAMRDVYVKGHCAAESMEFAEKAVEDCQKAPLEDPETCRQAGVERKVKEILTRREGQ